MEARRRLPRAVFDFVDGGAGRETTLRENATAFDHWRIVPRLAVDTVGRTTQVRVLGAPAGLPLVIAPTGLAGLIRPKGELILARAAAEAGIPFCLSTMSVASIEDVAAAAPEGRRWFQLYPLRDQARMDDFLHRAERAGYEALCIAIDQPTHGRRMRDLRNGFTIPLRLSPRRFYDFASHPRWSLRALANPVGFGNFPETRGNVGTSAQHVNALFDPSFTWEGLKRVRDRWPRRLVIKGVLAADDADLACSIGADAVVVSNHGGRQLDDVPATIFALPAVAAAVAGRAEILIDGGVRSAGDIVKALALGATSCMIGRPGLFALAAGGAVGAQRLIDIFREELLNMMALMGTRALTDLGPHNLVPAGRPLPIGCAPSGTAAPRATGR